MHGALKPAVRGADALRCPPAPARPREATARRVPHSPVAEPPRYCACSLRVSAGSACPTRLLWGIRRARSGASHTRRTYRLRPELVNWAATVSVLTRYVRGLRRRADYLAWATGGNGRVGRATPLARADCPSCLCGSGAAGPGAGRVALAVLDAHRYEGSALRRSARPVVGHPGARWGPHTRRVGDGVVSIAAPRPRPARSGRRGG